MSGECDDCGEHALECICRSKGEYILACVCGSGCPCRYNDINTHLNVVRNRMEEKDPFGGIKPPAELPPVKWINIRGRREHEAIIKDAAWCKELGLDQMYETMIYLKRWGDWLSE